MLVSLSEEQAVAFRVALQSEGYPAVIVEAKQGKQDFWFVCRDKKEMRTLMEILL
jgi:hypothetical protein